MYLKDKKNQGRTLTLFDVGPFSFSRQADVGHFYFYMISFGFSFPECIFFSKVCQYKII